MKMMWYSAALLLLIAVTAQAQEETKKAPFEWKTSGDTVETFKAEFILNAPVDQSTPEGLINGYAILADGRTENAKLSKAYHEKASEVLNKAVHPLLEKLLSEEVLKAHDTAVDEAKKAEDDNNYKVQALTITAVSDGKDGAKLVETLQKSTYMSEGWDPETGEPTGKMEENVYETKSRFTVIKGEGGKWRIDGIEQLQKNWAEMDDMGNAPEEWQPTSSPLSWYLIDQKKEKAEDLKQDTPENAALSLYHSVFLNRTNWSTEVYARGQRGWVDTMKSLFTENGLKEPESDGEKFEMPSGKREVDKVSDGTEGVKKVKLKPRMEWFGGTELHVKKVGDVWKIVKVGYYDMVWNDMGDMVEGEFTEVKNLEELAWR